MDLHVCQKGMKLNRPCPYKGGVLLKAQLGSQRIELEDTLASSLKNQITHAFNNQSLIIYLLSQ